MVIYRGGGHAIIYGLMREMKTQLKLYIQLAYSLYRVGDGIQPPHGDGGAGYIFLAWVL